MAKLWLLLLFALGWPLTSLAACSDAVVNATRFSAHFQLTPTHAISDQALQESGRLYFYGEFQLAHAQTLTFQWHHDGKVVQTTQLQAQKGLWRGWSAYPIKHDGAGQWKVTVEQHNGCGIVTKTLDVTATYPVLHKARQLIRNGDVLGAKLQLKKALKQSNASRAQQTRWHHFMATHLMLAEARVDIAQHRFLAAKGRLQSLEGKLDASLEAKRQALWVELTQSVKVASRSALYELIAAIDVLSLTADCPTNRQAAVRLLKPLLTQPPRLAAFSGEGTKHQLLVTLPGGTQKQLTWHCDKSLLAAW